MPTSSRLFRPFVLAVVWGALVAVVTNYLTYRDASTLVLALLVGAATGYLFYLAWILGVMGYRWYHRKR